MQKFFENIFDDSEKEKFFDSLEETLLVADVGIEITEKIISDLRKNPNLKISNKNEVKNELKNLLQKFLVTKSALNIDSTNKPHIIMIVGINGAGKTTTIAKLCDRFHKSGMKVLVGAADTFRAAAVEQLKTWADKLGIDGVFPKEGTNPSSVAFDATKAAQSRGADLCIIDTAGRLHTKTNLMEELSGMKRAIAKALPGAPHQTWLVIDGTMGQNALQQAKEFHQFLSLTGLVITKLDGSSKGGSVLAISSQLNVPVEFIGVGEKPEDLIPFEPNEFIDGLLESFT